MPDKKLIETLSDVIIRSSGCPPDRIDGANRQRVQQRLTECLGKNDGRLEIVLPAFPFKSANRTDKVLSADADYGEALAIQTLGNLCAELNKHVPTHLTIVSDGHVFNDLDRVPDADVDSYYDQLRGLTRSPHISFRRLADFLYMDMLGTAPVDVLRQRLVQQYADNIKDITDLTLYCGMKKFMGQEQPRTAGETVKAFGRRCGDLAKQFYKRSQGYSALIDERMPDAFRLTIHPRADWTSKVPVQLVPARDRWATPWHNVAVCNDSTGEVKLMHRKDAEKKGYELETKNGKPWRYVTPKTAPG